ncbi:ribosomal large subunit pseudouridine synthase D [Clostridium cavendishii DSM 21758]|uniref:Pseudouridine synthase n=1 Tax=Clostridium cavendishii DSM 21758 TaxID=1121302 RepID=A0A1M6KNB9_9CLOT|nr:RluA family pseudouridine synthase [Clostridium cavendishii]SHJ60410.1 ribosomal large subunit pseudouridine synthase D [Clostridium cavendishii DSM 21758]
MEKILLEVQQSEEAQRIDKLLTLKIEKLSRNFIQGLFENESIKVNDKFVKSKYKVKVGDKIEVDIPEAEELRVEPEDIPLNIIYEDEDVVVINKPQGMVVHPAPGNYNGTLVNALLYHCKDLSGINGVIRPGIVHRIDKDTSGVLVVAKNDNAHNHLAAQFKEHSIKREYYALVEGRIKKEGGVINAPIGRHVNDRLKFAVVKEGKHAVTHYEVLEVYGGYSLVKCRLETGRTHQIRVHMSFIGHPLVGDTVYGLKKQKMAQTGQVLHAKTLGFIHPKTNEYIEFDSELPENFKRLLEKLRKI